ncbi:uncharacterized protein LOC127279715 [Leptopilina boulardi]|uniref:uncharacterized protein LOC127279715 n=1 Tax=Leptopilina boulardi TaxID=63433 RepID=UPI0021F63585|nr:uncharacterized protein LOC127279715 [Leptopilina boulardi]
MPSKPRLTVNSHLTALMSLPYLKKESANELQSFSDEAQRIVRALKNLDMPLQHWDIWLVYILTSRLDPESRKIWESELSAKDRQALSRASESGSNLSRTERFASFDELVEFLDQRSNALCMIASESKINKSCAPQSQSKSSGNSKRSFHISANSKLQGSKGFTRKCSLCSGEHYIGSCLKFLEKSTSERRNEARRLHLCFNCLGAHHSKKCESKRRCLTCKEKHHSSLHAPIQSSEMSQNSNIAPTQTTPTGVSALTASTSAPSTDAPTLTTRVSTLTASLSAPKHSVVLATAQVILTVPRGTEVRVRALLDQGSEASFVTESIVQLLKLPRCRTGISLTCMGASVPGTARSTAQISLRSIHNSSFHLETHALVLPRLTSHLPSRKLLELDINQFEGLSLADPHFFKPDSVDLILGSDIYCRILRSGLKRFHTTSLIVQDTTLGWVVSGSINNSLSRRADLASPNQSAALHFVQNDDLQNSLEKFWSLEEISDTPPKGKPDDILCEQFYADNSTRLPEGRHMVHLPLNSDPPKASSETRQIALSTLSSLHRRFDRDRQLADAYCDFMRAYEQLGHMGKVSKLQINNPRAWYIPHHALV